MPKQNTCESGLAPTSGLWTNNHFFLLMGKQFKIYGAGSWFHRMTRKECFQVVRGYVLLQKLPSPKSIPFIRVLNTILIPPRSEVLMMALTIDTWTEHYI